MNQGRSLVFEALEGRILLSGAHANAHNAKAQTAERAPLVLHGTLTVKNSQTVQSPNITNGTITSTMTAVPIAGLLSGLGKVQGYWMVETDASGDDLGPDVLSLHSSRGSFTVEFDNETAGSAYSTGKGTLFYEHAQIASGTSGSLSGETESGTLDLNMNRAHTTVASITLSSSGS
jgi:hypothetical protein